MGRYLSHRHDQITNADRRVLSGGWTEIQIYVGLRTDGVENGRDLRFYSGVEPYFDQVRLFCACLRYMFAHTWVSLGHRLRMVLPSSDLKWPPDF